VNNESPIARARSEADDACELDYLRGYLERDPSCPAREVRDEIVRKLQGSSGLAHAYIIPLRGDPCALCKQPSDQQAPGGCPIGIRGLYSRIGEITDEATAHWEAGEIIKARSLEEQAKRLSRLHAVLRDDLAPAVPEGGPRGRTA